MPILHLTHVEGPAADQRRRLIERVTAVVVEELGVPIEAVHVVLTAVPASEWGHAGRPLSETLRR